MATTAAEVLSPILRKLGLGTRKLSDDLPDLITGYPQLDAQDRRKVREALDLLGFAEVARQLDPNEAPVLRGDSSFTCPIVQLAIVSPCGVDSCRYHLERETDLNCLLVASAMDRMIPSHMTRVFGIPAPEVEAIRTRSMRKMRRATVSVAREQRDLTEEFTFLKNPHMCGVCEKRLPAPAHLVREGVMFCSPECVKARIPEETLLEARFGTPARRVVRWAQDHFETLEAAAQALGFPAPVLQRMLNTTS